MAKELQVRINTLYNIRNKRLKEMETLMAGWLSIYGDDTLMLTGVKISLDGSGGGRTAWLYEDWNKDYTQVDVGNKGYYRGGIPYEEFKEVLKAVHKAGLQITAHCIGDRGIDEYIKIIEEAVQAYPRKDSRHTVAHCNLSTKEAIERMKRLGDNIVIEPSSVYMYTIGDSYAAGFGPERSKRIIPLKTWLKEGLIVGNSSDYTSSDLEPWLGLYAAVVRRPLKGTYGFTPFGLDECVTIQQALRTYTADAAKCLFWENKIGFLEAGKYADIVVWDKDMYKISGEQLKDLKVTMTMIGGKVVYQAQ